MLIIAHYKGSKMIDIITPSADHYNCILETKITDRLIRSEDGTITSMWNNLSLEELEIVKEMIANNNYTTYVSFMNMNKRKKKIDKLLNEKFNI